MAIKPRDTFPVHNLGKALFLILTGHEPVAVEVEGGKLVFLFSYKDSAAQARVFQSLMDEILDEIKQTGKPMPVDHVVDRADELWAAFEKRAQRSRVVQA